MQHLQVIARRYLKTLSPFCDPSTAAIQLAASCFLAKVTYTPIDWLGLVPSFALLTTILMILPYCPKYWSPRRVCSRSSSRIRGFSPTTYTKFFCTTRKPARCFRLRVSTCLLSASFCRAAAFFLACTAISALNLTKL